MILLLEVTKHMALFIATKTHHCQYQSQTQHEPRKHSSPPIAAAMTFFTYVNTMEI
jgi:hypothetical protein